MTELILPLDTVAVAVAVVPIPTPIDGGALNLTSRGDTVYPIPGFAILIEETVPAAETVTLKDATSGAFVSTNLPPIPPVGIVNE